MAQTSKADRLDPSRQHLGNVYAKALLGAAEKAGQADEVVAELESIVSDVFDRLPSFEATLKSLRLTHEERVPIIEKAFAGKITTTTLTFLKVLSQHSRLDCLRTIARAARQQLNVLRRRVEVIVETAHPLTGSLRERIIGRLSELLGQQVILTSRVNENLLGGLVVRVGDTVFDASLAARLRKMQEVTLSHTKQTIRDSLDRFAVPT